MSATPTAPETYAVMAVSTAHLSVDDHQRLSEQGRLGNMVMTRDTGYFVKLYFMGDLGESVARNASTSYSGTLNALIGYALRNGYQMIEFDDDAALLDGFARNTETINEGELA